LEDGIVITHHLLLDQPLAFVAAVRALPADWEHSVPRGR
jgi:hypothetical protein